MPTLEEVMSKSKPIDTYDPGFAMGDPGGLASAAKIPLKEAFKHIRKIETLLKKEGVNIPKWAKSSKDQALKYLDKIKYDPASGLVDKGLAVAATKKVPFQKTMQRETTQGIKPELVKEPLFK